MTNGKSCLDFLPGVSILIPRGQLRPENAKAFRNMAKGGSDARCVAVITVHDQPDPRARNRAGRRQETEPRFLIRAEASQAGHASALGGR